MEDNILESLSKLEESLKQLDSARTMVNNTIASYSGMTEEIQSYTTSLSQISGEITELIKNIRDNKDSLSENITTELKTVIDKFDLSMTAIQKVSADLVNAFKSEADMLKNGVSEKLGESTSRLGVCSDQINSKFNHSANEVVDSFKIQIDENIKKFNAAVSKFSTVVDNFNSHLNELFEKQNNEFLKIQKQCKINNVLLWTIVGISIVVLIISCVK